MHIFRYSVKGVSFFNEDDIVLFQIQDNYKTGFYALAPAVFESVFFILDLLPGQYVLHDI